MDLGNLRHLSENRQCKVCGEKFKSEKDSPALQQFADHTRIHQPSGDQWSQAYAMIQAGKEREKRG